MADLAVWGGDHGKVPQSSIQLKIENTRNHAFLFRLADMARARGFPDFEQAPLAPPDVIAGALSCGAASASGRTGPRWIAICAEERKMEPEQVELERLRRELMRLKADRDILKRIAARFGKDPA